MNKIFLLIILLQFELLFSQNTKIDKNQIIPRDINFNDNVKKITLKVLDLDKKAEKTDTISEIYFSKLKKILKINKKNR
jgi:hypothetical protein